MKLSLSIFRASLFLSSVVLFQSCLGKPGEGPQAGIYEAEAKALFKLTNDVEAAIHSGFIAGSFADTYNCSTGTVSREATGSANFNWSGSGTPHSCTGSVAATGRLYNLTGKESLHATGSSSTNYTVTVSGTLTTSSQISGDCAVNYTITVNPTKSYSGTVCGYDVTLF